MRLDEDDVDLLKLTDRQFEEACFDLLLSMGYQGLSWHQGGADSGRDIEGRQSVDSPLVGTYTEKWFFECKRYEKGVPPEELNSKIAWADAEKPNHLVVLTSSYLTRGARTWLDKVEPQKPYAIHVVDGKALRRLFSGCPEIVARHFVDGERKLLLDARRTWLVHNIIPEAETLSAIAQGIQYEKLSAEELAFLWCSAKMRHEEIERLIEDTEPLYLDPVFDRLASSANMTEALVSEDDDFSTLRVTAGISSWEPIYNKFLVAELVLNETTEPRLALYAFVRDSEGEGLEVLVEASGDLRTRTRYIVKDASTAENGAAKLLFARVKKG